MASNRILVVNSLWPHPGHSVRAANVVTFEMLSELARQSDGRIGFLKVSHFEDAAPTSLELEGIEILKRLGVEVLPEVRLDKVASVRNRFEKLLFPKLTDFYPEIAQKELLYRNADKFKPDFILIAWNEWLTAVFSDYPKPKFAYYGNPNPKPLRAINEFNRRYGLQSPLKYQIQRYKANQLERLHLEDMRHWDFVGDVAANDAEYYREQGHKNSFYIQNIWIDRLGEKWKEERKSLDAQRKKKNIIVANIGRPSATANTLGLEILGRDFVPALRKIMGKTPFELHLFGHGNTHSSVEPLLQHPEIIRRGFVDDIDRALMESDVFLCLNNGSAYKVGHTRYLHAWTLGCAVVAHKDAALSMPEIQHEKNALLGDSAERIAELVAKALGSASLRDDLGTKGYETYHRYFRASSVVPRIIKEFGISGSRSTQKGA